MAEKCVCSGYFSSHEEPAVGMESSCLVEHAEVPIVLLDRILRLSLLISRSHLLALPRLDRRVDLENVIDILIPVDDRDPIPPAKCLPRIVRSRVLPVDRAKILLNSLELCELNETDTESLVPDQSVAGMSPRMVTVDPPPKFSIQNVKCDLQAWKANDLT
jgi:hypothetical protein